MEQTIRDRVRALFEVSGVSQREFAEALGYDPSWVSQFFSGSKPANNVHLLLRIARYFGVTVGYLLNETERGRDAGAMMLMDAYGTLGPRERHVVLNTALMLKGRTDDPGTTPSHESGDGPSPEGGTTKGSKKRR